MLSVDELVDRLIDLSFAEDIGDGDHTTLCCIPEDAMGKSHLLIKEDGILAGVEIAKEKDPFAAADGAPDAEHHAAYERYRYDDRQIRAATERYEDPCARHP